MALDIIDSDDISRGLDDETLSGHEGENPKINSCKEMKPFCIMDTMQRTIESSGRVVSSSQQGQASNIRPIDPSFINQFFK